MIRHPDEERIRQAFDAHVDSLEPRDDCPVPDRIWDAVNGSLPFEDLDAVSAHATACADCAAAWRLALDVRTEHVEPAATTPSWTRWALPVAAMVILGLLVVPMWRSMDRAAPSEFRTRPAAVELRSTLPTSIPLDRDACVLRWSGPEGAVYEVVVAAEDTTVLARIANLREPRFRVPPDALETIPDGATIVWNVKARLSDGTRPAPLTARSEIATARP